MTTYIMSQNSPNWDRPQAWICFSGSYRNFNHSLFSNYRAIVSDDFDFHVVAAFWSHGDSEDGNVLAEFLSITGEFVERRNIHVKFVLEKELNSFYLNKRRKNFGNPRSVLPMYYSLYLTAEYISELVREIGVFPSLIIRSRTDLGFRRKISLVDVSGELNRNRAVLVQPLVADPILGLVNDQFMIASLSSALEYFNLFSHIGTLIDDSEDIRSERLLGSYLAQIGMRVYTTKDIFTLIQRENFDSSHPKGVHLGTV
jgi:hypothetical protein